MIPRGSVLASAPELFQPADLSAVLEAALAIAVKAWIQIRRSGGLTEEHRRHEPRTAGLLYRHMVEQEKLRQPRLPKLKIKSEVGTFSSDVIEVPDGRIDIEIIYSLDDEADLRLECKRVSTSPEDDPAKRAAYYVEGGILRFVENKYGWRHRWGVLIGFVIDGRFPAAAQLVADRLGRDNPTHLHLPWRPAAMSPRRHLFETEHLQDGGPRTIRLLHLFLPFPRRSGRPLARAVSTG